jgi:hypothetical protein
VPAQIRHFSFLRPVLRTRSEGRGWGSFRERLLGPDRQSAEQAVEKAERGGAQARGQEEEFSLCRGAAPGATRVRPIVGGRVANVVSKI